MRKDPQMRVFSFSVDRVDGPGFLFSAVFSRFQSSRRDAPERRQAVDCARRTEAGQPGASSKPGDAKRVTSPARAGFALRRARTTVLACADPGPPAAMTATIASVATSREPSIPAIGRHRRTRVHPVEISLDYWEAPATACMSGTRTSLTRGRPRGAPRPRSCSSIACQPRQPTTPARASAATPDRLPRATRGSSAGRASRSSSNRATVSAAQLLLVPMTPGRAALDPADGVFAGRSVPSGSHTRPPSVRISPRRSSKGTPGAAGRGSRSRGSRGRRESPRARPSPPPGRRRPLPRERGCATTRSPVTGPPPSPRISTGERQKRSSIRCDLPAGAPGG